MNGQEKNFFEQQFKYFQQYVDKWFVEHDKSADRRVLCYDKKFNSLFGMINEIKDKLYDMPCGANTQRLKTLENNENSNKRSRVGIWCASIGSLVIVLITLLSYSFYIGQYIEKINNNYKKIQKIEMKDKGYD